MKKQPDITNSMRAILVDWLVEVGEEYNLQNETLYLAVNYIDRFLSSMSVLRGKLQLVGTAAMLLASYVQLKTLISSIAVFVEGANGHFAAGNLRRSTPQRWQSLSTSQTTPTPRSKCWEWSTWCWRCSLLVWRHPPLTSFSRSTSCTSLWAIKWKAWQWWATLPCAVKNHDCSCDEKYLYWQCVNTFSLEQYLSELSLVDCDPFLKYLPSLMAAAAFTLANNTVAGGTWVRWHYSSVFGFREGFLTHSGSQQFKLALHAKDSNPLRLLRQSPWSSSRATAWKSWCRALKTCTNFTSMPPSTPSSLFERSTKTRSKLTDKCEWYINFACLLS